MADLSFVTWISLAVVLAALIAAHIAIGQAVMHIGNDRARRGLAVAP